MTMALKRIFIFFAICFFIFFIFGSIVTILTDFYKGIFPYDSLFEIFGQKNLYIYGTTFLIGFFINFIASKINLFRYLFPMIVSGASLNGSGYEFINEKTGRCLIKKARKEIIICAQNHHYLANDNFDGFKKAIKYLIEKKIVIKIIMNDVEYLESAIAWEDVCFPQSFKKQTYKPFQISRLLQNNFYHQLISATRNFFSIAKENPDFIDLSIMPHVPTSITFVDPKEKNGFIVIVPNFYQAKNTSRPYFVVKKKYNKEIFKQYYESYRDITADLKDSLSEINKVNSVTEYKSSSKINKTKFVFSNEEKKNLIKIEPIA